MVSQAARDIVFEQFFVRDGGRIRRDFMNLLKYGHRDDLQGIFESGSIEYVLTRDWKLDVDHELQLLKDPYVRQGYEIWQQGLLVWRGPIRESQQAFSRLYSLFKHRPAIKGQA